MIKKRYIFNLLFVLILCSTSLLYANSPRLDSLKRKLAEADNRAERTDALWAYSEAALTEDPKLAAKLIEEGLNAVEDRGEQRNIARFLILRGTLFLTIDSVSKATETYARVERIYAQLKDSIGLSRATLLLANAYRKQGDYNRAIETYTHALTQASKFKQDLTVAQAHLGLGFAYFEAHKDTTQALKSFKQAIPLLKPLNQPKQLAEALYHAALLQKQNKNYADALLLQQEAFQYYRLPHEAKNIELSQLNLAQIYIGLNQAPKAVELLNTALEQAPAPTNKARLLFARSEVEWAQQKGKDAIATLLTALELAKTAEHLELQRDIYERVAEYLFQTGEHEKAYNYRLEYTKLKEKLFNENKAKEIGRMESRFEVEKKIEEQKRIEEENERKEKEWVAKRNNLQYLAILGSLTFLFVGLFLLGRLQIPERLVGMMLFFAFLLFFEFILLIIDPFVDDYTGGVPLPKLGINAVLALTLAQMHRLLENRLRNVVLKRRAQEAEAQQQTNTPATTST